MGLVLGRIGREGEAEAVVDRPGAGLVVVAAIVLFGALVSKLLGYPPAPEDKDKYLSVDRFRATVLLKIWPLAAVALVVGIVMLVTG